MVKTRKDDACFDIHAEETCWAEWFEGCTIGKCGPGSRRLLAQKGRANFKHWLKHYGPEIDCTNMLEGEAAWLVFETHMLDGSKHYKNWLRKAAGSDPDRSTIGRIRVINSNINRPGGLFNNVVRQWIVMESGSGRMTSRGVKKYVVVAAPSDKDGNPCDLDTFLPPNVQCEFDENSRNAIRDDVQVLVESCRPDLIAMLTTTIRVAMAARVAGVSLAEPGLARFAGVGRNQTNESIRDLDEMLSKYFNWRHRTEWDAQKWAIKQAAIGLMMDYVHEWLNFQENSRLRRFLAAKGKYHETF